MKDCPLEPEDAEAILLVEDDEAMRDLLQMLLEGRGYQVIVTRNGTEALKVYKHSEKRIRVIISDVEMPGLNGAELYWQIREMNPMVNMIMISGFLDPQMMRRLQEAGVRCFLQKPFSPEAILKALQEVFQKP